MVMITGAVPGLGKSSLCRQLTESLGADGHVVDRFDEDDILTCAAFHEVVARFQAYGRVATNVLVRGAVDYLGEVSARHAEIVVQDMLFPYLPSLLAWGYSDDDIAAFLRDLASALSGADLLEVHLEGDVRQAIERASLREGEGWLEGLVAKVDCYADSGRVTDTASLAAYLDAAQARTRRLLTGAPWPVLTLPVSAGFEAVSQATLGWVREAISSRSMQ